MIDAAAELERIVTLGLSAARSGVLVFGGSAAAFVSLALALVARRALALDTALILAIVGGGMALAALSLWYLG